MSTSQVQDPDGKAVRLVEYLLQIARLRTKPVQDLGDYVRVLRLSAIPRERGCHTRAWGADEEHPQEKWLEIQSRREPELPAVPVRCEEWVDEDALRSKDGIPRLRSEIIRQEPNPFWAEGSEQPESVPRTEWLVDHPDVQQAWDRYVDAKWRPWTEEHNTWERIHGVYTELFAIHQEQLRLGEEHELVLGLGLLTWETPSGQRIRRHLLVADAVLEFEARMGRFTVQAHPDGAKLRPELDMLDVNEQPVRAEASAREALEEAGDDPWETDCVEGVLQTLVHSINPLGYFDDSLEAKGIRPSGKPIVEFAPALILRKRSAKGLTDTLNRIKEQIECGGAIPDEFADLAEIRRNGGHEGDGGSGGTDLAFDGEVFFPKPSNDEQRRIVEKLRTGNGLLVQGPPGTGKSHTIANLICHLLATGQRLLITAKAPRALQVLEKLVPEDLRPLCINLLGSGLEERRALEASVSRILRENELWREVQANEKRGRLRERLEILRAEKAEIDRRLRDIRESETHTQSVADGTYRGTAAEIAKSVNRDRTDFDWFTDDVPMHGTCPTTAQDLRDVLMALRQLTPERRAELDLALPESLPSPEHFGDLLRAEEEALQEGQHVAGDADNMLAEILSRSNPPDIDAVIRAFIAFKDARAVLLSMDHPWMAEALRDILCGNSSLWQGLCHATQRVVESIQERVPAADNIRIALPDSIDVGVLDDDVRAIRQHLDSGGKLGWWVFRPKAIRDRLTLARTVMIGGQPCSTPERLAALSDYLGVRIEFDKAWSLWAGRSERTEGPYAFQLLAMQSLCDALGSALAMEGLVAECRDAMSRCSGIDESFQGEDAQLSRIISSCRLALARIRKREASKAIEKIEIMVSRMAGREDAHPITGDLLNAVRSRDMAGFAFCENRIHELEQRRLNTRTLEKQLSQLRDTLPHLTASLEQTHHEPCWDERLQRIGKAWNWAQARSWIGSYIRQEDVPALSIRTRKIEDEIHSIIAGLASLHAWSFCFTRLKEEHCRHMEAWQQSMRRLGKGTGKHAPRHRREAQAHLDACRSAIPAWVMPLHRVWDTVSAKPEVFDVIIVDEASQCGLEALPLFYLGKKIVIVGDDKQISPDAVGMDRDLMLHHMNRLLPDFEYRVLLEVESSLFDHGKLRYGKRRIPLREHFRCMPEIIRFSNDLCYADTPLIPLRQYGSNRLRPLDHVPVSNGYRQGTGNRVINRPEAEMIVSRIVDMCGDRRYDGKTMGVVVLQGEAQATLIENMLLKELGAEEIEKRGLICGNPYSFQGDQRDIIFLSLVAAANETIGPFTKPADERRFNVAASRACDMMILFHSVTRDDLSASCLRRKLLEFFENTAPQEIAGVSRDDLERLASQCNRSVQRPPAPFDSWFEVDVALVLLRKGYHVLAQHEIAGKRIDLVVDGGRARLAVECDGDNWHGADRYEEDMRRQRQLERCGWEFYRVREAEFYANRETALRRLWVVLEERGILPRSVHGSLRSSDNEDSQDQEVESAVNEVHNQEDFDPLPIDDSSEDTEIDIGSAGRRVEDIPGGEIRRAIISALDKCPNQCCALHSLIDRVAKELGFLSCKQIDNVFEYRVRSGLRKLQDQGLVLSYKAKNWRFMLTKR